MKVSLAMVKTFLHAPDLIRGLWLAQKAPDQVRGGHDGPTRATPEFSKIPVNFLRRKLQIPFCEFGGTCP